MISPGRRSRGSVPGLLTASKNVVTRTERELALKTLEATIDTETLRPRLCDIAFSHLLLNTVQIHAGKTGHGLVHQAVDTSKHGLGTTGQAWNLRGQHTD